LFVFVFGNCFSTLGASFLGSSETWTLFSGIISVFSVSLGLFFSNVLTISILVSFIVPSTFISSLFVTSSVFNPFTFVVAFSPVFSSDFAYVTSYLILYSSSLSILSISTTTFPIFFCYTYYIFFENYKPTIYISALQVMLLKIIILIWILV